MGRDVIAVSVADDGTRPWLARIEPQTLLGKVDACIPKNRIVQHFTRLLGSGGGLEQFIAERAVGAEALARWPGEHAGPAADGTRLFAFFV